MLKTNITDNLYQILDFEIYILLLVYGFVCLLFYKILLKNVSAERHQSLQRQLKNLFAHFLTVSLLFLIFNFCFAQTDNSLFFKKITPYAAGFLFLAGAIYFVKTSRLFVLQYLFLGSMRAGVPLLLVNIFSLLLSIVIALWSISHIFNIQVTPLLATSAAFSIILGLALQDTLGNLFAGISLQVDKSFEIGDWLEIQNGPHKITGQVKELSWRSTLLIGFSDEQIVLPNKLMASCQLSNFSPDGQPIVRSQTFKVPHETNSEKAKSLIESAVLHTPEVRALPEPYAFITEVTENWTTIKVIYYLDNFGKQFSAGDRVIENVKKALHKENIEFARQILEVKKV